MLLVQCDACSETSKGQTSFFRKHAFMKLHMLLTWATITACRVSTSLASLSAIRHTAVVPISCEQPARGLVSLAITDWAAIARIPPPDVPQSSDPNGSRSFRNSFSMLHAGAESKVSAWLSLVQALFCSLRLFCPLQLPNEQLGRQLLHGSLSRSLSSAIFQ